MEQVEETICRWSARLAAATYTWLTTIAAFDRRQGWAGIGIRSCAHWLAWRCGLDLRTAREQLATAHALQQLSAVRAAFSTGELSYSKVRAITRVAGPDDEADWLRHARQTTASRLERLVSRHRQQTADPAKLRAARKLALRANPDGSIRLTATLSPDDAAVLVAALDAAGTSLESGRHTVPEQSPDAAPAPTGLPEDGATAHTPRGQIRDADALIAIAEAFLHHGAPALQDSPHSLTVHVPTTGEDAASGPSSNTDASDHDVPRNTQDDHGSLPAGIAAVTGWSIGLPGRMVARLGCDALIRALITDRENNPLHLGRRNRLPTRRLRDAVYARDQGVCQFPSCEHTKWLQIHHCHEWDAGNGNTDIEDLLLICGAHHRAIHDEALMVRRRADGTVIVRAPGGRTIVARGGYGLTA
ncbi:Restriction endonuclease [Frankia sp. AiPs1]|uniref:HNH endonuclease signature motif containing protein n=1 Tax=Frankia sp. AiPa1 TaxID=573492 RepID=UPI00202BA400|nr:HNH endonuclease signature motif containing protein [Frankia sp. AiPa1]MCL9762904.1 HNH endonuclease [Frankia sp. AiPa1]